MIALAAPRSAQSETADMNSWMGGDWSIEPYNVAVPTLPIAPPASQVGLQPWEKSPAPGDLEVVAAWSVTDVTWFDSNEWQAGERNVDALIRVGQVHSYPSMEGLLDHLHRLEAEREKGGSSGH